METLTSQIKHRAFQSDTCSFTFPKPAQITVTEQNPYVVSESDQICRGHVYLLFRDVVNI